MSISISNFGVTDKNEPVKLFTVKNNNGASAVFTNWGATAVSIFMPDKNGKMLDVLLGFDNLKDYLVNHCYFGATVGRNGNRVQNAQFQINGKSYYLDKNEKDKNDLHSGFNGYQKRVWDFTADEENNSVTFKLLSPDMDQGFPGDFNISVTYTLTNDNGIEIQYNGICNKDTVANMTNHSYFNLNGHNSGSIINHDLKINSTKYAVVDNESIPTGVLADVTNTPLDFTNFRRIADDIDSDFEQIKLVKGYDHSFLIDKKNKGLEKVATLKSNESGINMDVYTDCLAVQFYAGNYIDDVPQVGKGGFTYGNRSGLCLETGFLPNSINEPKFASPVLKANTPYVSKTIYKFSTITH